MWEYYARKTAIAVLRLLARTHLAPYRQVFSRIIQAKKKCAGAQGPILLVENTNRCNAKCSFCPRDQLTRPQGVMAFEFFRKIVDEGASTGCRRLKITGYGEPFTDPGIIEKIIYAKAKGIPHVSMFTNGSLIGDAEAADLVSSGLDEIFFSIDTGIASQFNRLRKGLSFQRVDSALTALTSRKWAEKSKTPAVAINAIDLGTSGEDIRSLYRRYRNRVDRISVQMAHNWTTRSRNVGLFKSSRGFIEYPCPYPYYYLTIRVNGDVSICCFDFDCKTVIGNIGRQTIGDVWQGPQLRLIRAALEDGKRSSIRACQACTQYPNWWARLD